MRVGGVGDLVALLREKLADLRPRLERVADPRRLVDRWVEGLDDPDAWWPTLLDLAVTAHGLGDEALRDRVLARLAGVDDEYWSGAELVDVVRRWMSTPAAGR